MFYGAFDLIKTMLWIEKMYFKQLTKVRNFHAVKSLTKYFLRFS